MKDNRDTNNELLISLDLEADGPIPGDYSLLSLGTSLIDFPKETFYIEFQPISEKFDAEALAVCGLDREALKVIGVPAREAMETLERWVNRMLAKYHRDKAVLVILSTWDMMYVDWYSVHFLGRRFVGFTAIDLKSYFMGKHGIELFAKTGRKEMLKYYPVDTPHTHRADDDALEQGEIARQMFDK